MSVCTAPGTRSSGKKVLHRKVIGRMTKVENRVMSAWVLARTAAMTPRAPKVIPLSSITRKKAGLRHIEAPKGNESSRMSTPLYIPRRDPPSIWPKL